jgi:hypothetical protein
MYTTLVIRIAHFNWISSFWPNYKFPNRFRKTDLNISSFITSTGRIAEAEHALAAKALKAYEKYSKSLDPDETFIELDEEVAQGLKAIKRRGGEL